jgi:hypothetical protein
MKDLVTVVLLLLVLGGWLWVGERLKKKISD